MAVKVGCLGDPVRAQPLAVETWNVNSLNGKEPGLVREIERYRVDMVGVHLHA